MTTIVIKPKTGLKKTFLRNPHELWARAGLKK
jgi:hypothetical protein